MNDKLFAVISTIAGLVIGWTLNELSDIFKTKRENKRILNQTLFIQLEIRAIILKTNIENVTKQIEGILKRKFSNDDDNIDLLKETIGKILHAFIQNELNNNFSNKIPELIHNYKNCISSLSQIDPFTTYYISGKDVILDYLGYIANYFQRIKPYLTQPVLADDPKDVNQSMKTFKDTFDDIKDKINPLVRSTAIETIETDIRIIAKRISFIRYLKTKRFLKISQVNKLDNFDIKKIESYLNDF